MAAGVYRIVNVITGKVYVGSSVDMQSRWDQHRGALRRGDHHSRHLQRAWDKHGENCFTFEVVMTIDRVDGLIDLEQHWIDALNSANGKHGYNVCPTAYSMLGFKHSESSVARMSAAKKGRNLPAEHKEKIRLSSLGNKSRAGQKQTEEEKQKRSQSVKAFWAGKKRTVSEAARAKMRTAKLGKKQSKETVDKRLATIQRRKNQAQGVTL